MLDAEDFCQVAKIEEQMKGVVHVPHMKFVLYDVDQEKQLFLSANMLKSLQFFLAL